MKKLEIELFRYNTLVFGQVLSMDEKLRGKDILAENENFSIESSGCPDLDENILYVRGDDKDCDNAMFSYNYDTEDLAIETCENIKNLVDEINSVEEEKPTSNIVQVI